MSNFIKLTSMLINTSKISMIEIQNNKYCIHDIWFVIILELLKYNVLPSGDLNNLRTAIFL